VYNRYATSTGPSTPVMTYSRCAKRRHSQWRKSRQWL